MQSSATRALVTCRHTVATATFVRPGATEPQILNPWPQTLEIFSTRNPKPKTRVLKPKA
jgi:hypothetical protein